MYLHEHYLKHSAKYDSYPPYDPEAKKNHILASGYHAVMADFFAMCIEVRNKIIRSK